MLGVSFILFFFLWYYIEPHGPYQSMICWETNNKCDHKIIHNPMRAHQHLSNVLRFMPEDLVRISFVINRIDNGIACNSFDRKLIFRLHASLWLCPWIHQKTKLCEWYTLLTCYYLPFWCRVHYHRWFHRWRHKIVLKYK